MMMQTCVDIAANVLGLLGFVLLAIPGVKALGINREVKRLVAQIGTFDSAKLNDDLAKFADETKKAKDAWKPADSYMLWAGLLLTGGSYVVLIVKDMVFPPGS
jgi:hypothetical protein